MEKIKNEQLKMEKFVLPEKAENVAFSGHRDILKYPDFSPVKLYEAVETCIKNGATRFYCGMARGFDLLAGECVVTLQKIYPRVKLIAYIPHEKQYLSMNDEEVARYTALIRRCDPVLSKTFFESYVKWCMTYRNDRLVEKADVLIAFLREKSGGTAYTVKKFLQKKGDAVLYV